jgi:transcriptional regulator with XRE-family HTH domain
VLSFHGPVEYHERDNRTNTIVMQAGVPITGVKEVPDQSPSPTEHDLSTLAGRAAWARERLGLTQEGLAKAVGVGQSTIGNMESGIRQQPRKINAIAKALHLHVEWLETGKGPRLLEGSVGAGPTHHAAEPAATYAVGGEQGLVPRSPTTPFDSGVLPLREGEEALLVVWRLASQETRADVVSALEQSALTTNELLMRSLEKLKITKRADDERVGRALPPAPASSGGTKKTGKERARND